MFAVLRTGISRYATSTKFNRFLLPFTIVLMLLLFYCSLNHRPGKQFTILEKVYVNAPNSNVMDVGIMQRERSNSDALQDTNYHNYNLNERMANETYMVYKRQTYSPWTSYPDLDSLQFEHSVVSAFILVDEQNKERNRPNHDSSSFLRWMKDFYVLQAPLITFIDVNLLQRDEWKTNMSENLLAYSDYMPRIIVPFSLEDLESYYHNSLVDLLYSIWGTGTSKSLCYIWLEKIHFVRRVALSNPFQSRYFFWLDIGFFREFDHREIFGFPQLTYQHMQQHHEVLWPNSEQLKVLQNDRMWMLQVAELDKSFKNETCTKTLQGSRNNAQHRYRHSVVAGIMFAGTKRAVFQFDMLVTTAWHDAMLWTKQYHYKSMACVEQNVWQDIFCHFPDIATIIKPPVGKYTKSGLWVSFMFFFETNSTTDWIIEY